MSEKNGSPTCDRAEDLIAVLYGEASGREAREFEIHLEHCQSCRAEFASFARVRESIGEWREEALSGFASSPVAATPVGKSAMAALRQFFDFSPLWLKGVVGFAAAVFCVLAALAVARLQPSKPLPPVANAKPEAIYTQDDVDRMVKQALATQEIAKVDAAPEHVLVQSSPANNSSRSKPARIPKAQRPFSKAEREQLAADLRLLSTADELDLDLIDDRINR